MLDFFTIFSKGGIVLFYFQSTKGLFLPSVNALIRSVLLEERGGKQQFHHDSLQLQYKLDNEFDLVFVVGYQKFLQLNYVDKFLNEIQLRFRDEYKNNQQLTAYGQYEQFEPCFKEVLRRAEDQAKVELAQPKAMKTYQDSEKSKKTIDSLIVKKGGEAKKDKEKEKPKAAKSEKTLTSQPQNIMDVDSSPEDSPKATNTAVEAKSDDEITKNREKLFSKRGPTSPKAKPKNEKKTKQARTWDDGVSGKEAASLNFSKDKGAGKPNGTEETADINLVGTLRGELPDIDVGEENEYSDEDDEVENQPAQKTAAKAPAKKGFGSMFSVFKGLVGNRTISQDQLAPILDKMRVLLIEKNVAAEIAEKLVNSVGEKLEGKSLGTFEGITSVVRTALQDALVKILTPKKPVNVLRDALAAKKAGKPFVITFCGVNGVGKSTNLAKICFWFLENELRVLIAACDTFRAGAVEQLRTHRARLNTLHPNSQVELYEKGYGKDAAGIAAEAIQYARDNKFDVVLVDTAGRMQDNEPLMRSLAKLIKLNQPDMVLFVGEALVGNEAVDQVVKFNQALADFSQAQEPRIIDGIVLTKFDTIDDKVGAAVSMAYITGQPIVFVGTGQTYTDLKNLNTKAVVNALMK
ncbi:signal recognition particle receptor subunit alpha homolog [Paramacrobiotus metropolitanus]|uniref:signal recognition particle receptor subunit alpha homolog n=1 Tax=Paramacrobiotus metropolitanus TaxID=2943436 RepID=UPI002445B0CA|nr:signal recognition particle receptor subunit alpha homolog [Paramacrobiotus metropolitanus]